MESVEIKADFEKAYDKVRWDFQRKVLLWLGAPSKWCDWIDLCISNAKVVVLVNGIPTQWIKTKRGLRQGCPLSPYLFLLVAESLTRMTKQAARNGLIRGVGPNDNTKIAILQYADDAIFFCEAKRKQTRNLLFIWQVFEWASRLKINRSKSELFYMGNNANVGSRLATSLECKLGSLPMNHLGLPLQNGRLKKEDWWTIIGKMEKRIEGWQAKLLSQGGRLVLVNSVLSNLALYFFSVFKAPKWVVR